MRSSFELNATEFLIAEHLACHTRTMSLSNFCGTQHGPRSGIAVFMLKFKANTFGHVSSA